MVVEARTCIGPRYTYSVALLGASVIQLATALSGILGVGGARSVAWVLVYSQSFSWRTFNNLKHMLY